MNVQAGWGLRGIRERFSTPGGARWVGFESRRTDEFHALSLGRRWGATPTLPVDWEIAHRWV